VKEMLKSYSLASELKKALAQESMKGVKTVTLTQIKFVGSGSQAASSVATAAATPANSSWASASASAVAASANVVATKQKSAKAAKKNSLKTLLYLVLAAVGFAYLVLGVCMVKKAMNKKRGRGQRRSTRGGADHNEEEAAPLTQTK
jgi:hypothetical protein